MRDGQQGQGTKALVKCFFLLKKKNRVVNRWGGVGGELPSAIESAGLMKRSVKKRNRIYWERKKQFSKFDIKSARHW